MIQWQPMDALTAKEEHGEIIVKWGTGPDDPNPGRVHSIWFWVGDCWNQRGNPVTLTSFIFRARCLGWQRLFS